VVAETAAAPGIGGREGVLLPYCATMTGEGMMGSGQAAPVAQHQQHTCTHHPPALVTTTDC